MRASGPVVLVLALLAQVGLYAQSDLYDIALVREIRLYFEEENWSDLLDTLYLQGDERMIGDLEIDGVRYPDVGVRYKGFSSYSSSREKNPFNIKLDHIHSGQNHQGYEKLKLSNVIQDPSFLRETMTYEIARKYMPASQANFANLYVNDVLIGLYTNVEDVSKEFVDKHFGSRGNAFVKCNPTTVDLNGENSNLSDTPGADPEAYHELYSLESDEGWEELLGLINVLNSDPAHIDQVLNVDRTLWMHAVNYTVINFDSYVGYAQNYYLYKDDNDRWNPILWDLNMSFASFRLTDASTYWNGFSIAQAMSMDPLKHWNNVSVQPRPLLRKLFENPTYRRMYLAHMRTILDENFADQSYYDRATTMRDLIRPFVQADTNKFYTDQAFESNLDQTVSFVVDYPGIAPLMNGRAAYLYNYAGFSGQPVISAIGHSPEEINVGDEAIITANIQGSDSAFVAYRCVSGGLFEHVELKDDGLNGDGAAEDGLFGARITVTTNMVEFYIYAENSVAGAFSPPRAAYEFHAFGTRITAGAIVINEFRANNPGAELDQAGEAEDWIELRNMSGFQVSTAGLYLSDDPNDPSKWAMPVRTLAPGEYLMIWADEDEAQGDDHASFKLDDAGESLLLAYADGTVIDQVHFGAQYPISTTGRYPNGTGSFRELYPTFGAANTLDGQDDLDRYLRVFPNPSSGDISVIVQEDGPYELNIIRSDGARITPDYDRSGDGLVRVGTASMGAGVFVLEVRTTSNTTRTPFVLIQ
ncbi:MAG: CotH kinase family protein [Flavobacteriales bacterium]